MTGYDPDTVPVRTAADWDEQTIDGESRVTISREVSPRNRLDRVLFEVFGTDRERELTLDAVGTTVWKHCDGTNTLRDVAAAVTSAHDPDRVEPVEETLSHFLVQLRERGLIRLEEQT